MNLADSHYRTLETKGQEPIDRMESIVCRGIPEEFHEIARRNLNMALASKHEDRAGEKSGEDWRKELTKAQNYMYRAVHGCWIGKEARDKESLGVGVVKESLTTEYFNDPKHGCMESVPASDDDLRCEGCHYERLDGNAAGDECPCDRPYGKTCNGIIWRKVAEAPK